MLTEMMKAEGFDHEAYRYALVEDVQSAAGVEQEAVGVRLRPAPLAVLLLDAETVVRALPGDHPVEILPQPGGARGFPDRFARRMVPR